MRTFLPLALTALVSTSAFAGIPDPSQSSCHVKGQVAPCQFRFRADGGLDCLTMCITIRDAFSVPVSACTTHVTLTANAGTIAYCNCCPDRVTGYTDTSGSLFLGPFGCCIGGRGSLDLCVTAQYHGFIAIDCKTLFFTSPDLDADCLDTDVIDLGIWAGGLSPYSMAADYNCDGTVNVLDLGIWAGGLGQDCGSCACPEGDD